LYKNPKNLDFATPFYSSVNVQTEVKVRPWCRCCAI